jgi:hypothetical protein
VGSPSLEFFCSVFSGSSLLLIVGLLSACVFPFCLLLAATSAVFCFTGACSGIGDVILFVVSIFLSFLMNDRAPALFKKSLWRQLARRRPQIAGYTGYIVSPHVVFFYMSLDGFFVGRCLTCPGRGR